MLRDKYKPLQWSDFVGNSQSVKQVRELMGAKRFTGGAFWITGPSGTGKTTMANLIASEVGANYFGIENLDGDKCTVDAVRKLKDDLLCSRLGGSDWVVVIVNEAHAMTDKAVQAFLTLLDELPENRIVVFTTTETSSRDLFGNFTGPLLGRCYPVELDAPTDQETAFRLLAIARAEGMDLDGETALRIAKVSGGSIRSAIQRLDIGAIPPVDKTSNRKPVSADTAKLLAKMGIAA